MMDRLTCSRGTGVGALCHSGSPCRGSWKLPVKQTHTAGIPHPGFRDMVHSGNRYTATKTHNLPRSYPCNGALTSGRLLSRSVGHPVRVTTSRTVWGLLTSAGRCIRPDVGLVTHRPQPPRPNRPLIGPVCVYGGGRIRTCDLWRMRPAGTTVLPHAALSGQPTLPTYIIAVARCCRPETSG